MRASVRWWWFALLSQLLLIAAVPAAAEPEPSGPHPRLFLEAQTEENLRSLANKSGTVVSAAVARCKAIEAAPESFARDGYMGLDWAQYLQTCLIAWKATGRDGAARTATRYFRALLDDLQMVGDGKGGDGAARRDSGYSIRALGPYSALAYDWLHDAPGVDAALLARARARFKAWTDWYATDGYRPRSPGTNYNAGYFLAATLIAVAQGNEAGEDGARLWRHVVDTLFAKDLLPSMTDGVLQGGDWGEGWQYGPLSVAEYALAARAVAPYGLDIEPVRGWLGEILTRHVHGLTPAGDRTYAVGDTDNEDAYLAVRRETLAAVVAGPAPLESKQWAMAELTRLGLLAGQPDFQLFPALAEAERVTPVDYPREASPRAYFARGTSILYTHSNWSPHAIWLVTPCSGTIDVDHTHANAGSFVLSRGSDDVIVDPSPYGTLSSLTSNAPTVVSDNLPKEYLPSQAFWGRKTGFRWIRTPPNGIIAARCDYADQYRIQDTPSDIPLAYRDLLLIPYADRGGAESALLFVMDRSKGRTAAQSLHLRFRIPARLELNAATASGKVGSSMAYIRRLAASPFNASSHRLERGSCFTDQFTRGNCDAARIPVSEISAVLAGPQAYAMHLIEATPQRQAISEPVDLGASGGTAWSVERDGASWVVAAPASDAPMSYLAPATQALHAYLPYPVEGRRRILVEATRAGASCRLNIGGEAGVEISGAPGLFTVDAACNVTEREAAKPAAPAVAGRDS
ncbi:MAG: hypothetical protein ACREVZ_00165 [Burkholderiales bacterium]